MSREAERTGFKRREEELVGIEQWLEMNKCSIKNGEGLTMQTSHSGVVMMEKNCVAIFLKCC